MKRCPGLLAAVAAAAAFFALAPDARSQVVVYQLDFEHEDGFNVDFFEGGFFVAPALGGTGTFILTAREDGRKVLTSSAGSGNFFAGFDEHGKRITVVSATNGASSGGTIASYVAMGEVNGTVEIHTSAAILKVRIAKELRGMAIAAGDESNTTTSTAPADTTTTDTTTTDTGTTDTTTTTTDTTATTDTSTSTSTTSTAASSSSSQRDIGFADISKMTLNFDTTRTERANDKEQSVDGAAAELVTLLKQKGYVEDGDTGTSTDTTTTTPDTSTGTTIDTGTTTTDTTTGTGTTSG